MADAPAAGARAADVGVHAPQLLRGNLVGHREDPEAGVRLREDATGDREAQEAVDGGVQAVAVGAVQQRHAALAHLPRHLLSSEAAQERRQEEELAAVHEEPAQQLQRLGVPPAGLLLRAQEVVPLLGVLRDLLVEAGHRALDEAREGQAPEPFSQARNQGPHLVVVRAGGAFAVEAQEPRNRGEVQALIDLLELLHRKRTQLGPPLRQTAVDARPEMAQQQQRHPATGAAENGLLQAKQVRQAFFIVRLLRKAAPQSQPEKDPQSAHGLPVALDDGARAQHREALQRGHDLPQDRLGGLAAVLAVHESSRHAPLGELHQQPQVLAQGRHLAQDLPERPSLAQELTSPHGAAEVLHAVGAVLQHEDLDVRSQRRRALRQRLGLAPLLSEQLEAHVHGELLQRSVSALRQHPPQAASGGALSMRRSNAGQQLVLRASVAGQLCARRLQAQRREAEEEAQKVRALRATLAGRSRAALPPRGEVPQGEAVQEPPLADLVARQLERGRPDQGRPPRESHGLLERPPASGSPHLRDPDAPQAHIQLSPAAQEAPQLARRIRLHGAVHEGLHAGGHNGVSCQVEGGDAVHELGEEELLGRLVQRVAPVAAQRGVEVEGEDVQLQKPLRGLVPLAGRKWEDMGTHLPRLRRQLQQEAPEPQHGTVLGCLQLGPFLGRHLGVGLRRFDFRSLLHRLLIRARRDLNCGLPLSSAQLRQLPLQRGLLGFLQKSPVAFDDLVRLPQPLHLVPHHLHEEQQRLARLKLPTAENALGLIQENTVVAAFQTLHRLRRQILVALLHIISYLHHGSRGYKVRAGGRHQASERHA